MNLINMTLEELNTKLKEPEYDFYVETVKETPLFVLMNVIDSMCGVYPEAMKTRESTFYDISIYNEGGCYNFLFHFRRTAEFKEFTYSRKSYFEEKRLLTEATIATITKYTI